MNKLFVDWSNGRVERQYRGARTVRFVKHMSPSSFERFMTELNELHGKGYHPTKWGTGWLYSKGAVL